MSLLFNHSNKRIVRGVAKRVAQSSLTRSHASSKYLLLSFSCFNAVMLVLKSRYVILFVRKEILPSSVRG